MWMRFEKNVNEAKLFERNMNDIWKKCGRDKIIWKNVNETKLFEINVNETNESDWSFEFGTSLMALWYIGFKLLPVSIMDPCIHTFEPHIHICGCISKNPHILCPHIGSIVITEIQKLCQELAREGWRGVRGWLGFFIFLWF